MSETKEETALAMASVEDLMAPAASSQMTASEAGKGSEDVGAGDVILPRIYLLQGLSKPVNEEEAPGAKAGRYWVTPYSRPATIDQPLKLVVVRIYPAWRRWTPLDDGGGIECEAAGGDLVAREANGLAGATLEFDLDKKKGEVRSFEWTGGHATDDCRQCVFGPAAAAAAAGKQPSGRGNPWLPKIVTIDGKPYKMPDEARAPRCTQSLDILALVALPPFKDDETGTSLEMELIPAFISFSRSSYSAGKSLAGMVKMASREPAWSKIYQLGSKKVTNDKGTFYIATISQYGYAQRPLMDQASALFESTQTENYRADMQDIHSENAGPSEDASARPPSDEDPEPGDDF